MVYMNSVKRGMFSKGTGKGSMKKAGLGIAKAVGNFVFTTRDGFKAINRRRL